MIIKIPPLIQIFSGLVTEAVQNSKIIDAINNHQVVSFYYNHPDPKKRGIRSGEIYAFGETKSGKKAISIYQLQGKTSTVIPKWKIFVIDYISNFKPIREFFRAREGFNSNNQSNGQMPVIYNIVDFQAKPIKKPIINKSNSQSNTSTNSADTTQSNQTDFQS